MAWHFHVPSPLIQQSSTIAKAWLLMFHFQWENWQRASIPSFPVNADVIILFWGVTDTQSCRNLLNSRGYSIEQTEQPAVRNGHMNECGLENKYTLIGTSNRIYWSHNDRDNSFRHVFSMELYRWQIFIHWKQNQIRNCHPCIPSKTKNAISLSYLPLIFIESF